ncbi:ubiquinone/menaquinone biosynthesis methyltransferase [Candidatus Karelsulcia muelleri]|uniref:ubiquinone/menaquinone biosynthesis methyltransferase n=1 Tax=Candidatus Karelsulcia muelleri TaxID=336810 RepID=UPI000D7C2E7A|nr:ubiquinone/menaquinone biosynthesis methyltransferase [Candidatus Karelsulcia muelleri]
MIKIKPFKKAKFNKTIQIKKMFDIIYHNYDKINNIISFGYDRKWRKKLSEIIINYNPKLVLDLATGTGNIPILLVNKLKKLNLLGIDISNKMISIGKNKLKNYKNVKLIKADCQKLFFIKKNQFDIVTIVFGIRNFENINNVFKEIYRVLSLNGYLIILEFSKSNNYFNFNYIYKFYSKKIIPLIIKSFYKNLFAYNYLIKSIDFFYKNVNLKKKFKQFNFKLIKTIQLTFGIVSIYIAKK